MDAARHSAPSEAEQDRLPEDHGLPHPVARAHQGRRHMSHGLLFRLTTLPLASPTLSLFARWSTVPPTGASYARMGETDSLERRQSGEIRSESK
jgi:hypothetical protein